MCSHRRTIRTLLALALIALALPSAWAQPTRPGAERVTDFVADPQRAAVAKLLAGYGPVLEILPLDELRGVIVESDALELVFDFSGKKSRSIKLASKRRALLPKGGSLRQLEVDFESTKERTLVIEERLRFEHDGRAITAVREGDLRVKKLWMSFDLRVSTVTRVGAQRDDKGRTVLETDAAGEPLLVDGKLVPVSAERFFVIEARGRRVEIPLP